MTKDTTAGGVEAVREALIAWQTWWELPAEAKRPDLANVLHQRGLAALAASPAPAPAVGVENLMRAVRRAEDGAGSLPARDAVKLRPADWHAVCVAARKLASPKAGETGNG